MNLILMLEDEVVWLGNFVFFIYFDMLDIDNSLLVGYFKFISILLICEGVDLEENGRC